MPLFHFHVRHEFGLVHDDEPLDLPDLSAVFAQAIQSSREFLAVVITVGPLQLEIEDAEGAVILKLPVLALAAAGEALARAVRQSSGVALH